MNTLFERWSDKVLIGDGCWEWVGWKNNKGYGQLRYRGGSHLAHRVSYELMVEPIPHGMEVCHRCDNPACVKPSHLFAGTHADNMRDAREKGRTKRGARHKLARLTEEQVADIRERYSVGEKQTPLADEFGVTQSCVSRVVRGETW